METRENSVDSFGGSNDQFAVWSRSDAPTHASIIMSERERRIQRPVRIETHDGTGRLIHDRVDVEKHDILAVRQKNCPRAEIGNRKKRSVKILIEAERAGLRALAR